MSDGDIEFIALTDLHAGPPWGLLTPDYENDEGNRITQNAYQREIWEVWCDMCDTIKRRKITRGLLVGDLTDGRNAKSYGEKVLITSQAEQAGIAVEALGMTGIERWYGVGGSAYHTGMNQSGDDAVYRALNAKRKMTMVLTIHETRILFRHYLSFAPKNRSGPVESQIDQFMRNEMNIGKMDLLLFGHWHYFQANIHHDRAGFTLPGWCGLSDFVESKNFAYSPHIGYVIFTIHPDGTWDFYRKTYEVPKIHMFTEYDITGAKDKKLTVD